LIGRKRRARALLRDVIQRYLESGDFNGLFVTAGDKRREAAERLIEEGAIEVVSINDFPNPHIRLWASQRTANEQIAALEAAIDGSTYGVCLYPRTPVLEDLDHVLSLADQPFRQRLARGGGQLDVVFFQMDVLEAYRNDPRFTFTFTDSGVRASITDRVYEDADEPQRDKVSLRAGFAYRMPIQDGEPVIRYVVAFLRDLTRLSPEHQRRWETYEVPENGIRPHPIWMANAMGDWTDKVGPFDAFFGELGALDDLHEQAFGANLLKTTARPGSFGWILRASQLEWDNFIQTLDKLLSENLRHEAFDVADIPRRDEDGQTIATLNRLDRFLERAGVTREERREVLRPLREVRTARSFPAHALRANISDDSFVRRQAELLGAVTASIESLRSFWQTHPRNVEWQPPAALTSERSWL
jgi:hypothetical protein